MWNKYFKSKPLLEWTKINGKQQHTTSSEFIKLSLFDVSGQ